MTRTDVKTLVWLGPLAVLSTLWWMLQASPCLDNALGNRWSEWFPPPPVTEVPAGDSNGIAVHNPYGIEACDYWPEASDHVITSLTIILIASMVGFLAARRFEQRAITRAAQVMGFALTLAFGLANFAFLPGLLRPADGFGYKAAAIEVGLSVVFVLFGVLLAMLAAWLTLRRRPRG